MPDYGYFSQIPHSGYHWRNEPSFFEGWYYRLVLPRERKTFAFMYSIQDPAGATPHCGGLAQILGPKERYCCRSLADMRGFWAWPDRLGHGHWRSPPIDETVKYLDPDDFEQREIEGYQVTATLHQGKLQNPRTGETLRWRYIIEPLDHWGDRGKAPQATAGWLSHLPIFEPGWQILMANGLATGWLEIGPQHYSFTRAPAYSEKNWGQSFPKRWFWISCNTFPGFDELSITAGGGRRQVLGWMESVGMLGLHYQGMFYEFAPWNSEISWSVSPWGHWEMKGRSNRFYLEIYGSTQKPGTWVQTPTASGLEYNCRDTTQGDLEIRLWEVGRTDSAPLLSTTTRSACLEVGGGPWNQSWNLGS